MTNPPPVKPVARARRRRRWALGCLTVFLLLIVAGLLIAWIGRSLWQSEPDYWGQNQSFVQATPPQTLEVIADNAFNRVLGELSQSRGYTSGGNSGGTSAGSGTEKWKPISDDALGVRTIRLSFQEANAWLAERLDDWLANQGREMPAGLSDPMLASDDGQLIAAFRFQQDELDQVISVAMSLKFLDNGQATMSVDGIWGGRLSLPVGQVMDRLPGGSGGDDSQAVAVLMGKQPFDPVLPIDGSRRARIIGMEVDAEGVGLVVQAEPNARD